MIDRIRTDVRYALRQLQRAPAFTLVASLSLAIGIGVAVGALSFLNALFFRPLPVPDPENIYRVYTSDGRGRHSPFGGSSYSDHLDFAQSGAFTGLAAQRDLRVALSGSGLTPSSVRIRFVSPNFFDVFGIRFTHGRPFSATGLETEVVIS